MSSFNNSMNGNVPGTSFFEQLCFWTISAYFYNQYKVELHYKIDSMEFDIAIPSLNILVECQSTLHISSTKMDKVKQNYCKANNIRLIQIMTWHGNSKVKINYQKDYIEFGCSEAYIRDSIQKVLSSDNTLDFNKIKLQKNEHSRCIAATYGLLTLITNKNVDIKHFCSLPWHQIWQTSLNKSVDAILPFEKSLASRPDLVKEFRGLVNYPEIQPRNISLGSGEYVNWECNTCGHKWQTILYSRTILNSKCPKCTAKAVGIKGGITRSICTNFSKSFFSRYNMLVPFIKANSIQEKEKLAKSTYASSNKKFEFQCPHCNKLRIMAPSHLYGATNIRCKECKRWFIE